jgi:hypothetical protein
VGGGGRLISCVVFRRGAEWCRGCRGRAGHETEDRVDVGGLLQAEMGGTARQSNGEGSAASEQRAGTTGLDVLCWQVRGLETDCWVVGGHQHRQEAGISVIHQGKSGAGRI